MRPEAASAQHGWIDRGFQMDMGCVDARGAGLQCGPGIEKHMTAQLGRQADLDAPAGQPAAQQGQIHYLSNCLRSATMGAGPLP